MPYRKILIPLSVLLLGFFIMGLGPSSEPEQFDPGIFGHFQITLAPLLILTGYVWMLFFIFKFSFKKAG